VRLLYENWQQFIVENKDSERVAKAVIYIDDKILFLRNDQGWDLPGGHIKKEESIKQGLVREIEEETGLKVDEKSIKDPVYRHNHMNVYEIHLETGTVKLSSEHDKSKLVHPDDIEEIKLTKRFERAVKKTFK
jgi:8-oxo-dGTP pyrophosphatase MutT (NUDIX family)|tara:strand:+ start:3254 stop:3652 length:399 start_codon:yes stop_codon:yes gene_type:complete